jgi:hypothetical protein
VLDIIDELLNAGPIEVKTRFYEAKIAVRLDSKEIKLYVDGKSVDTAKVSFFPKRNVALLRHEIKRDNVGHEVEVFGKSGFFRAKIKICVNGIRIAGDDF